MRASLTIHHDWELERGLTLLRMREFSEERSGYDTRLITSWPPLTDYSDWLFIGSFTWTCASRKYKLMQIKVATNDGVGWSSPADLARDYIRAKYDRPSRVTSEQYEAVMIHRQAPLYSKPGKLDDAVYLDLKSAYWSILQVIGWDVDYMPGLWLGVNSDVRDFPYWKNKLARNCLVSVGLVGDSRVWDGQRLIFRKKRNPLTNMVLWAAVQDVLNAIALEMVRVGAVYVHTDGYLLPRDRLKAAMDVIGEWGLVSSIRHEGSAEVIAPGTYTIGDKPNRRPHTLAPTFHNGIRTNNAGWLKSVFSKHATRRLLVLG